MMCFWNLLIAAPLISAAAIPSASQRCHPKDIQCGFTRFHITDLHISSNPNDALPEVSFHVSSYHKKQPDRSFGPTECKVSLDWGNEHHSLTGIHHGKCENPNVNWAFVKDYNIGPNAPVFTGWALQIDHHFRIEGDRPRSVDRIIKSFNKDLVMKVGDGQDEYTYIDTPSEFKIHAFNLPACYATSFKNSKGGKCGPDEFQNLACNATTSDWVLQGRVKGVTKFGRGVLNAQGDPTEGDACTRALIREGGMEDPFPLIVDVPISFVFHPDSESRVPSKLGRVVPRASVTKAPTKCSGTPAYATGETTATRQPDPAAKPGAFAFVGNGTVAVMRKGKEDGCLTSSGKYARAQSEYDEFHFEKWDDSSVVLFPMPVKPGVYCGILDVNKGTILNCEEWQSPPESDTAAMHLRGERLINGVNGPIFKLGEKWNSDTSWFVSSIPENDDSVDIHREEKGDGIELQMGWLFVAQISLFGDLDFVLTVCPDLTSASSIP